LGCLRWNFFALSVRQRELGWHNENGEQQGHREEADNGRASGA
jgi:hypothetical protein